MVSTMGKGLATKKCLNGEEEEGEPQALWTGVFDAGKKHLYILNPVAAPTVFLRVQSSYNLYFIGKVTVDLNFGEAA